MVPTAGLQGKRNLSDETRVEKSRSKHPNRTRPKMKKPDLPENEDCRIASLRSLDLLDSEPEERFDRFTRLAKRSFGMPIVLVSLVDSDRQWFKSRQGLDATETPRDISFCGHAIHEPEVFVVHDATRDERFADNPLVTGDPKIRFYAGCPIAAPDGSLIGTLCLIDREPREFGEQDALLLRDLGKMLEDDLRHRVLATIDPLTGLSNRRGFEDLAERVLRLCRRVDRPAHLLFIDLDQFKPINDRFGHEEGDRALCELSEILLDIYRETDVVGRHGGDEFCVLLAGTNDCKSPVSRLEARLEARNAGPDQRYALECSVGVVRFDPSRHTHVSDLLRDADRLMYERKRERRG